MTSLKHLSGRSGSVHLRVSRGGIHQLENTLTVPTKTFRVIEFSATATSAAKVNQNITKLSNGLSALKVIIAECIISWPFF